MDLQLFQCLRLSRVAHGIRRVKRRYTLDLDQQLRPAEVGADPLDLTGAGERVVQEGPQLVQPRRIRVIDAHVPVSVQRDEDGQIRQRLFYLPGQVVQVDRGLA